jgi:hypothetical protein
MSGGGGVTQVAPPAATRSADRPKQPQMEHFTPEPGGASTPSWPRVAWNTFVLAVRRSRLRNRDDQILHPRGRALLAGGIALFVALGGALYVLSPFGLERSEGASAPSAGPADSSPETRPGVALTPPQRRSSTPQGARPGSAHAAAGAEIAARTDIAVSDAAGTVLRSGAVDGRVLLIVAGLASTNTLVMIDVPPDDGVTTSSEIELAVTDVNAALAWLDTQPKLRPERVEIRRDSSRSFIRLIYQSPEPPDLFPS